MPSTAPEGSAKSSGSVDDADIRPVVQVTCGVLVDGDRMLIARRPAGKIGAGKWEFPGGKIEAGETARRALARELEEELGVQITCAEPLARLRHAYRDRIIWLDTWQVTGFFKRPQPLEGQKLAWIRLEEGQQYDLLGSSWRVFAALRLPRHYVFTPTDIPEAQWLSQLAGLPPGTWLRLRCPDLSDAAYVDLAHRVAVACRKVGIGFMVDRLAAICAGVDAAGLHLNGGALAACNVRPVDHSLLCVASVHGHEQLRQAWCCDLDAAVLAPVKQTPTHPGCAGMGWPAFCTLAGDAGLPVYALGGVKPEDMPLARKHGAAGIAGISAYWSSNTPLPGSGPVPDSPAMR